MLFFSNYVIANECVQCPSAAANEFVCGVDDKGVFRRFGSECFLRFENCEKKTSKETNFTSIAFE